MIGSNEARRWRVDTSARDNPDAVRALEDELGLYRLTASLLYSRGYRTPEAATAFLRRDDECFHDPLLLPDMDKAVERIKSAISKHETVAVYGDYDVDGITSTCLLTDWLRSCGLECYPYIPDRIGEGYGLNNAAIDCLHKKGVSLIISVDCGITAAEEAKYARLIGVDLIITDHHECREQTIPDAIAVIDPKQDDCRYPNKDLAGVGVALKLVCAVEGKNEPIVERYADLAAIGTVADVVPLTGENRYIVRRGLELLGNPSRPGLAALLRESGASEKKISSSTIGFSLAPRLNAAGRLGEVSVAGKLLMTHDTKEASTLAGELCEFYCSYDELAGRFTASGAVYFDSFLSAQFPEELPPKRILSITAKQLPGYGGSLETAVQDLKHYAKNGFGCLVLCGGKRRGEILKEMLSDQGVDALLAFPAAHLPQPGQILLTDGSLPAGMEYPETKLAVLTEGQIMVRSAPKKPSRPKKATNRKKLDSFTDLTPGDLVVHEHHGIGRYVGMEQMKVDGAVKDYVKIAYQGSDALYVPATQLDLVSKYIGGGEDAPVKLNKLGGDQWQKAKAKAKAAAKDLAAGLIKLYAERKRLPGFAFAADSPWQKEFEDSFEYAETDDQLRCIDEIKHDMESPAPMDRLLCGDVGFGKTEVALRAAMKCILDGKQVAILVPTTVLAQQHYVTATSRFGSFPVTIDVLSRFRTANQQKKTLMDLRSGRVDLIIGTHKLLQKDIRFKDLGLLIIDEEQRFGVTHKERLKELSRGVDVLTLSATPIPRTLNMALSGLRDMSTIEEPPQDRYPVQTFVLEHSEQLLLDAIRRELERGGQVYYLHNRVETIDKCAARIKALLGDAGEVGVAHGKMGEEALSDVMQRMSDGEIQVLVCTTIIETGLDIPNVNTLIIEDADRLGLAQLHQLRGRVGRSSRHAYAYLTFRRGKVLSEIAEKRLSAIREYAEFGSGFKIAMRDLEIRGAGDLLGAEQSGHMLSVGYDMYLKLLEDAVLEERGEKALAEPECTADLNVTANIDKRYVPSGEQRMDLYRRMAAVRTQEDADDLLDELVDRYGDPPKGVMNLLAIALLRARAAAAGITEITQKEGGVMLTLAVMDFPAISAVCAEPAFKSRIFFSAGKAPALTVRLKKGEDALKLAEQLVSRYAIARNG